MGEGQLVRDFQPVTACPVPDEPIDRLRQREHCQITGKADAKDGDQNEQRLKL